MTSCCSVPFAGALSTTVAEIKGQPIEPSSVVTDTIRINDGSAAAPSLSFDGATTSGLTHDGQGRVGIVAAGGLAATFGTVAQTIYGQIRAIESGTAGAPTYSFQDVKNAGMLVAANTLRFAASGAIVMNLSSVQIEPEVPMRCQDGTFTAPSYSFASDPTLGLYRSSAGVLGVSSNGSVVMNASSSDVRMFTNVTYKSISLGNRTTSYTWLASAGITHIHVNFTVATLSIILPVGVSAGRVIYLTTGADVDNNTATIKDTGAADIVYQGAAAASVALTALRLYTLIYNGSNWWMQ